MEPLLIATIDYCYGLYCKHCNVRVLDPDKNRKIKQKYTEDNCPVCCKNGLSPLEEELEEDLLK